MTQVKWDIHELKKRKAELEKLAVYNPNDLSILESLYAYNQMLSTIKMNRNSILSEITENIGS